MQDVEFPCILFSSILINPIINLPTYGNVFSF
jgi:hypothetical protein